MSVCASCGHAAADEFQFCPQCGTRAVPGGGGLVGKTLVGKYRITGALGEGSTGTVYLAEHVSLRRPVAIKLLHRELQVDEEALHRFQREGIAAGRLQHPNAVQVFDFDRTEDGGLFLAMEFVEGKSLRALLQERGALPPAEVLELSRQLLSVLAAAHAAGIVHRDLKPENLMLADGSGPRLVVLDFGLSKLLGRPLGDTTLMTHAGRVVGTPLYMAPEQWLGEDADERTDVHAAGLVLFELLTGKPPFPARDVAEAMRTSTTRQAPSLQEAAPDLAFPPRLDELVAKALAKDRAERWPSAAAMLEALDAIDPHAVAGPGERAKRRRAAARAGAAGTATSAGIAGRGGRAGARAPRAAGKPPRTVPVAALAAGGLALAIVLFALFGRGDGSGTNASGGAAAPLVREVAPADRSPQQTAYLRLLDAAAESLRRGEAAAALAVLDRALESPEADAEGSLLRARAHRALDRIPMAAADLDVAERLLPDAAEPRLERGWLELERGDHAAADRAFAAALATATEPAATGDATAGRAAAARLRGDAVGAAALLRALPPEAAERPAVKLELAIGALGDGRADDAIAALAVLRQRDATDWRTADALGDAHAAAGDFAAAAQQWRDAVARADRPAVRRKLIEALLADGKFMAAEQELTTRGSGEPALDLAVRALAARARGDAAAAAAILAENPVDDAPLQALLACLELQRGRPQQAAAAAQRAGALDDTLAEVPLVLGLALHRLGEHAAASQQLLLACALAPGDAFAHRARGILCMDWLLQPDAALAHFRRCEELAGDSGRADAIVAARIAKLAGAGADAAKAPVPRPAEAEGNGTQPLSIRALAVRQALAQAADRLRAEVELHEDHETWDKAWEARSKHFAVRTTHSYGLANDLAIGLERMLERINDTLGTIRRPKQPLAIHVHPTIDDYNKVGEQFGQEHSSFFGSFYADQAPERMVAATWDANPTLLRIQISHSMVHQYLADAFPQAKLPPWVDEGLAAYFSFHWDFDWARAEYARLRANGAVLPLKKLLGGQLADFQLDTHSRFVSLAILFDWLLRVRDDTKTTEDDAPFRDWVFAQLQGSDASTLPFEALLRDLDALDAAFRAGTAAR